MAYISVLQPDGTFKSVKVSEFGSALPDKSNPLLFKTPADRVNFAGLVRGAMAEPVIKQSALLNSLNNGPGTLVSNAPGMDATANQFGLEQLFHWLNGLKSGVALSVGLVGDSNMEAYRGPILQALLTQIPNVTVVNYGVGNTTLRQSLRKTAPYNTNNKDLATVIAAGHNLIISGWDGTNTPAIDVGGTPDTFKADLEEMMTLIRAGANGSPGRCSVLLCTSSAQADGTVNTGTTWKRDMLFKSFTRNMVAAAAKKYACAFYDVSARMPDPMVDFAKGSVGVDTWFTNNRLHPINAQNDILAQGVYEFVVPSVYRTMSKRLNVSLAQGFTQPATIEDMSTKRVLSHVFLEGRLNNPGLAAITKDMVLFAINSAHTPRIQVWNANVQLFDGTNQPMTPLRVNIGTDGQVKAAEAFSTFTTTSVRMRADWEAKNFQPFGSAI